MEQGIKQGEDLMPIVISSIILYNLFWILSTIKDRSDFDVWIINVIYDFIIAINQESIVKFSIA